MNQVKPSSGRVPFNQPKMNSSVNVDREDPEKNLLDSERQQLLPQDEIVVATRLTTNPSDGISQDFNYIFKQMQQAYSSVKDIIIDGLQYIENILPNPQRVLQVTQEALHSDEESDAGTNLPEAPITDYYRGLRNNQADLVRKEIINLLDDIDEDVESVGRVTRAKGVRGRLAGPTIYAIATLVIEKHGNIDCSKEINSKTVREFVRRDDEASELFKKINRTDKEPAMRRIMNIVTIPSKITLEEMRAIRPYGCIDRIRWRCSYLGSYFGFDSVQSRMAEISNFVGKS